MRRELHNSGARYLSSDYLMAGDLGCRSRLNPNYIFSFQALLASAPWELQLLLNTSILGQAEYSYVTTQFLGSISTRLMKPYPYNSGLSSLKASISVAATASSISRGPSPVPSSSGGMIGSVWSSCSVL